MNATLHKTVCHELPFTDKREWAWPLLDEKLVLVFEHVFDIDRFMEHVDRTGICVQAGGACGVWPYRYAQLFDQVYTFEPHPENWYCLTENLKGLENVTAYHAPLSNDHRKYSIANHPSELKNYGAGYVSPDENGLEAMCIDDLNLPGCDLIELDIEGYELQALQGAEQTIREYKPVIILEEKRLNHQGGDYKEPARWLSEIGYKQVDKVHWDIVLKV